MQRASRALDRLPEWIGRLAGIGAAAGDSEEVRLRKATLVLTASAISVLAWLWTGLYGLLGFYASAAIPLGYTAASWVSIFVLARTKRWALFRFSQVFLMLVLPVVLQWTLGGFSASGAVMLWAVFGPLGALVLYGARRSFPWVVAYVALALLSGLADTRLAAARPAVPEAVSTMFFVMNALGPAVVLYMIMRYFVRQQEEAQERSDRLLLNILPQPIANRLKRDPATIAEAYPDVTVLFADIVEFTKYSQGIGPRRLVEVLDDVFSAFDRLAERYGLEKIKTIGDAYMVVGGLPTPRPDHAEAVAEMALEMDDALAACEARAGARLRLRIGIHSGPVVAGVIGRRKFIYDLWGDTVNTASRMESHGLSGVIQVTEATYERLRDRYRFEERGTIDVKGKGPMRTYLLLGRAAPVAQAAGA